MPITPSIIDKIQEPYYITGTRWTRVLDTIQAIRFTPQDWGMNGNGISIEFVDGAVAGSESVLVVGKDIVVTIQDGVSTPLQVSNAINANVNSFALVKTEVKQPTPPALPVTAVAVMAQTNLTNGLFEYLDPSLGTWTGTSPVITEGAPEGVTGDLIGVYGNASNITGNVTNINGDVSGIRGPVSNIKGNVSDLTGFIGDLSGTVTQLVGDVTGISGTATNISGNVSNLNGTIKNLSGNVSNLIGDITDITGRVNYNEASPNDLATNLIGNITNISGTITGIYGDPSNISGSVSSLRGNVSNITGDVSRLRGTIAVDWNATAGNTLYGDLSNLRGDITGIYGTVTSTMTGDLDAAGLTTAQRQAGVHISELVIA